AGLPEGDERIVRRNLGDQSELQEGAGVDEQLHDQRIPVVPGRRARLRQLHGAQSAELTGQRWSRDITARQTKTPERKPRGFFSFDLRLAAGKQRLTSRSDSDSASPR